MRLRGSLSVITPPATEPVTVAECKLAAKIDYSDEDSLIESWIPVAREEVEHGANIALIAQTLRWHLDDFPCDVLELPVYPVTAVLSIPYVDFGGTTQTWDSSLYITDFTSQPPRIVPAWSQTWPVARRQPKSVQVNFTAGYASADSVPEIAKQAIRIRVAAMIRDRSGVGSEEYDKAFDHLISKLQRFGVV